MGLPCSKTAIERFNGLIDTVKDSYCLTVYAVSALLPNRSPGVPVYIFSEDHNFNESQLSGKNNCLKVIDALEKVSSKNCSEDNKIIFLYEGSTVSDRLYPRDNDLPNIDEHIDSVNINGSRYAVKRRLQSSHHIKAVPYDLFGRVRGYIYGSLERSSAMTVLTPAYELKAFWESIGYNVPERNFVQIAKLAKMLTDKMLDSFYNKFPESYVDEFDLQDAFTCYFLATLNFQLHPETPQRTACHDLAKADALELINEIIMSEEPELNPRQIVPRPPVDDTLDETQLLERYRLGLKNTAVFTLAGLAIDMIILEYLTGPTWREDNDHLVVIHVGYRHANNIQRWLQAGTHHIVHEKITEMATQDKYFRINYEGNF